jgi:ethanolamine utilization protein EutN
MFLGRIVGRVVSTMKNPSLEGKKILIVQPIDPNGKDHCEKILALDSVGAGSGEVVYFCRGREASFPWYPNEIPTDRTIVAIIDHIDLHPKSAEAEDSAQGKS